MNCEECKKEGLASVPFVVFDRAMSDHKSVVSKLITVIIILILLLAGSNIGWLIYESQFETVETTEIDAQQDGEGVNIVGGGDVDYGAEGKDNNDPAQSKENRR